MVVTTIEIIYILEILSIIATFSHEYVKKTSVLR